MKEEIIQPFSTPELTTSSTTKSEMATAEKPTDRAKRPSPALFIKAAECLEASADSAAEPAKRQQLLAQAFQAYQQAFALEPTNPRPLVRLAKLYEKMGYPQEAVKPYEEALKLTPDDAALWCEVGMFFGRQKQFDSAVECYHKAASLEPNNSLYSNHVGWGLARAGRFEESFEHFRQTVGEARAHYNLARMSKHLGDQGRCRQHLQAALQIDPHFADAQQLLQQTSQPIMQTNHPDSPQ
jgi:tetratricopeptide (TPR) repeat protein